MNSIATRDFSRSTAVAVCVVLLACATGCTRNPTAVNREVAARPRVEQLALATAMEEAYAAVDFSIVSGKKVYVETKALAKTDVEFITSFVQKRVHSAGGTPVLDSDGADLRLTSTVEVSGTDEVNRMVGKDVVMGQFRGSLAVVDLNTNAIIEMLDLDSLAQTKRSRRATTKVVD